MADAEVADRGLAGDEDRPVPQVQRVRDPSDPHIGLSSSSRPGAPAVGAIPDAITPAAPSTGNSAGNPGQVVVPSKRKAAQAMAASPTHPAAARAAAGARTTRVAASASNAPTPSSQIRVVETKNAVSGLASAWCTE